MKSILTGLARHLFGDVEMRWREDYFPFTEPSFELDIFFNGDWMEVLGCGVIHDEVMANAGEMLPDTRDDTMQHHACAAIISNQQCTLFLPFKIIHLTPSVQVTGSVGNITE